MIEAPKRIGRPTGRPAGAEYPFRAWRKRLGLTIAEAAQLIGRSQLQTEHYDKSSDLAPIIRLAMAALEHLPTWHLRRMKVEPYWRWDKPD